MSISIQNSKSIWNIIYLIASFAPSALKTRMSTVFTPPARIAVTFPCHMITACFVLATANSFALWSEESSRTRFVAECPAPAIGAAARSTNMIAGCSILAQTSHCTTRTISVVGTCWTIIIELVRIIWTRCSSGYCSWSNSLYYLYKLNLALCQHLREKCED